MKGVSEGGHLKHPCCYVTLCGRRPWHQCAVMRGKRRRDVCLLAVAVVLAVSFWACLPRLNVPRLIMRPFEVRGSTEFYKRPSEGSGSVEFYKRNFGVYGSEEFYNLLLDSSVANCSGGQPFKVK